MDITKKLKAHLVMRGLTQREVAAKSKMHYTNLNAYLNGRMILNDGQIKNICKALKLDFDSYKKGTITGKIK